MNYRCCGKVKWPKIWFRASFIDFIGIVFVGAFFIGVYLLVGWVVSVALWSAIESGEFGNRTWYGARQGTGALIALILLMRGMPIFFKILTFFVNYQLKVETRCRACGTKQMLVDLPTKEDPF